ncbi:uncharacterized protein LOC107047708 [Diachasma alloeum]|uniref:uncharacterized protein LOC107047708 n=1 Tax=Diachasma alloeum TaxID=454923 RepID=UPI000738515F|nr:uncharacterized protein LOC107047708 [Diachasma alloeum]
MSNSLPPSSPIFIQDEGISPKRRKFDTSNLSSFSSSTGTEEECRQLKTLLETFRARLSRTEATATQLHRMRREVDQIFLSEKAELQSELHLAEERIEQLQKHLVTVTKSNHELREALVAAEANTPQMKTKMGRRISVLSIENNQLKASTIPSNSDFGKASASPEPQEDEKEGLKEKLKAAVKKIFKLEQKLNTMISRSEFKRQSVELKSAKIRIQELEAAEKEKIKVRSRSTPKKESKPEDIELEDKLNSEESNCIHSEGEKSAKPKAKNFVEKMLLCPKILSISLEPVKTKALIKKEMSREEHLDDAEEAEQVLVLEDKKEQASRYHSSDSDTSSEASEQKTSAKDTGVLSMEEDETLRFQVDDYVPGEFQVMSFGNEASNSRAYRDFRWIESNSAEVLVDLERETSDGDVAEAVSEVKPKGLKPRADDHVLKECHVVLTKDDSLNLGYNKILRERELNFDDSSTGSEQETSLEGTVAVGNKEEEKLGDQMFEPHVMLIQNEYSNQLPLNSIDHNDSWIMSHGNDSCSDVRLASLHQLTLKVGKNFMLVSNSKFFQMDWRNEYRHIGKNKWSCEKCDWIELRRFRIEDHVWVVHYEECFKCPHCPFNDEGNYFPSRSNMKQHLKRTHPDLSIQSKGGF